MEQRRRKRTASSTIAMMAFPTTMPTARAQPNRSPFAKLATGLKVTYADFRIVSFLPELARMIVGAGTRCRFGQWMHAMRGLASHSSQSPHRLRERFEIDLLLEVNDDARFNLPLPGRLACVALIGPSADALAQSHPLTSRMSCAQARGLVAAQGSIVLNTSPLTYERYARGNGDCVLGETTEPAWVPTVNTAQCPIAYRCATRKVPSRS
jgi:hypothetical protein